MDMLGMMLKGMGLEPDAIMKQAAELSQCVVAMRDDQAAVRAGVAEILANQKAIMVHLGLMDVALDPATERLIAHESQKFLALVGP